METKKFMWRNFKFQYMTDVKKPEISPNMDNFQISPHDIFGDILNLAKFGGIQNICTSPCFCCKISFVAIYTVLSGFMRFSVEKNCAQKCIGGEI